VTPLGLEAPAKLNLSLRVVGRRDDGYHLLESSLVLLDLADRLLLMPDCSGLRVDGDEAAGVPVGRDNLAWRGLVTGLGAQPETACLTLQKRVRAAAGLGGGSSDAGAAWRLGRAWRGVREEASKEDLVEMSRIGADVPFFAAGVAAARVGGIGERVEPIEPVDRHLVLVHPPFGLATADVFAELRPDEWGRLPNDLLAPARRLRPELDELLGLVSDAGGDPQMTGSGPTLFSLTDDPERGAHVVERLAVAGVRARMTRTRTSPAAIERHPAEESHDHA
jgi:4-diphosphocytidyl-2-C-methyl-D-erythritol kinase